MPATPTLSVASYHEADSDGGSPPGSPDTAVYHTPPLSNASQFSLRPLESPEVVRTPRSMRFARTLSHSRPGSIASRLSFAPEAGPSGSRSDDEPESATSNKPLLEQLPDSDGESFDEPDDLEEQLAALGIMDEDELEDAASDDGVDVELGSDFGDEESTPMTATSSNGRGRNRSRARRKRTWEDDPPEPGRGGQVGLWEIIPPLVLSHPVYLLPLLPLLPHAFLPAGVVIFVPALVLLAGLSACANIVAVYLARYLGVRTFEDTCRKVVGPWGMQAGRAVVLSGIIGLTVGGLKAVHPVLLPVLHTVFPGSAFLQSRILWTVLTSLAILPPVLPSRLAFYSARLRSALALCLPLVVFLVIGRTVEILKANTGLPEQPEPQPTGPPEDGGAEGMTARMVVAIARAALDPSEIGWAQRGNGLFDDEGGLGFAAAFTIMTTFFSPHVHTLPTHSLLHRDVRSRFYMPVFSISLAILVLSLPFTLVPYYLLPSTFGKDGSATNGPHAPAISRAGIFAVYPTAESDHWLNFARVSAVALMLVSAGHWIARAREMVIRAVGAEREGRAKAGRWIGAAIWLFVTGVALGGGIVADKVELIGVLGVILVGWLLPSIFFITTFHVWTPLAIVFPSINETPSLPPTSAFADLASPLHRGTNESFGSGRDLHTHSGTGDPSVDILLARKERHLQKRRTGRRLWQDLIVFVGIFPVGGLAAVWTLARLVGLL